jgi:hypothetical protein
LMVLCGVTLAGFSPTSPIRPSVAQFSQGK